MAGSGLATQAAACSASLSPSVTRLTSMALACGHSGHPMTKFTTARSREDRIEPGREPPTPLTTCRARTHAACCLLLARFLTFCTRCLAWVLYFVADWYDERVAVDGCRAHKCWQGDQKWLPGSRTSDAIYFRRRSGFICRPDQGSCTDPVPELPASDAPTDFFLLSELRMHVLRLRI